MFIMIFVFVMVMRGILSNVIIGSRYQFLKVDFLFVTPIFLMVVAMVMKMTKIMTLIVSMVVVILAVVLFVVISVAVI